MNTALDAIIVGAGPAGCTAAIRLASAGWSVAIVEKRAFPRRKVCGECIAASNLPLLDALGVGEEFDALAGPELRQVGLFVGTRQIVAPLPPMAHATHRWGRALGREHLDSHAELLSQPRGPLLQPQGITGDEHEVDTTGGELAGEFRSDPGCCSGDEGKGWVGDSHRFTLAGNSPCSRSKLAESPDGYPHLADDRAAHPVRHHRCSGLRG